jgi:hypothetical protein
MEERKVAERRYRNLLKKSISHIDINKTDVFERLGFSHIKKLDRNSNNGHLGMNKSD